LIVKLKKEFPTWGASKLRERLRTHYGGIALPAKSSVHAVLDRHGLVKKKRSRRHPKLTGTNLSDLKEPNALWRTDYKGEFMLGNKQYCYPLTVTDYASRYLICCEGLENTQEAQAITVFEQLFKEYELPRRDSFGQWCALSLRECALWFKSLVRLVATLRHWD
jgi:hypothetical protein